MKTLEAHNFIITKRGALKNGPSGLLATFTLECTPPNFTILRNKHVKSQFLSKILYSTFPELDPLCDGGNQKSAFECPNSLKSKDIVENLKYQEVFHMCGKLVILFAVGPSRASFEPEDTNDSGKHYLCL